MCPIPIVSDKVSLIVEGQIRLRMEMTHSIEGYTNYC